MRSHSGLVVGYADTPEDFDAESAADEYIDVAYMAKPSRENQETIEEPENA